MDNAPASSSSSATSPTTSSPRAELLGTLDEATTPRQLADAYLLIECTLHPLEALFLGVEPLYAPEHPLEDFSPEAAAVDRQLIDETLTRLTHLTEDAGDDLPDEESVCARLLSERLTAQRSLLDAGEHLRNLSNLDSPANAVRMAFSIVTEPDDVRRTLADVPRALRTWIEALTEGLHQGLVAGERLVTEHIDQLTQWIDANYWAGLIPAATDEDTVLADAATEATRELRDFLAGDYAAAAQGVDSTVGPERYLCFVRMHTGLDYTVDDLYEAYLWGWEELGRIVAEMGEVAREVIPGRPEASVDEAFAYLDSPEGDAIEGVDNVQQWLQSIMDEAIEKLDGTYFDIEGPVRRVESRIAPEGSAAAPYYLQPSLDFSRPGTTWLPTQGRDRFPTWDLVSTWYHEGLPGHHLQLAQWIYVKDQLSTYQISLGSVNANLEGWALYAERLMNDLGFLRTPGDRMGYLDAQRLRAVRVTIDIGMHCGFSVPEIAEGIPGAPTPGTTLTADFAHELLRHNCASPAAFIDSEIVRYLGLPGQAISYKLGERAWLAGRDRARAAAEARGEEFDLKAWHMAALSRGSLGLSDLEEDLAAL